MKCYFIKTYFLSILLFLFYNNIVYCQSYNKPLIAIKDIEKGLDDIDYLRAMLLEYGLKFDNKESTENGKGKTIHSRSKGGQYYYNNKNNKVYVPKRK